MTEYEVATSTAIDMATYDDQRLVMTIRFKSGHSYEYSFVTPTIWGEYKASESKGRYFIQEIRNFYPFAKVG